MSGARWTPEQDAVLRARYAGERTDDIARDLGMSLDRVYNRAHRLGLHKDDQFQRSEASGRMQRADHRGREYWYPKGHVPANKGQRRPGWHAGRMRETQFKKGELSGRAKQLLKPIGTERTSKDGYLERKINNDLPMQARWRAVHLVLWEEHNGPVPSGHAVVFVNGNKRDIHIENLALITRAELMRRNTLHNYPKEIVQCIQLQGAIKRQINKRSKA
jgi:hypothetical protein